MGVLYFVITAPKSHHGTIIMILMLLPAASVWGAFGWHYPWQKRLVDACPRWLGIVVLAVMVVVQYRPSSHTAISSRSRDW